MCDELNQVEIDQVELNQVEIELGRVVDRLTSLALDRLPAYSQACYETAQVIVEYTRPLDPATPTGAELPRVEVSGLGWQLSVVGRDYLQAARAPRTPPAPDVHAVEVRDALVELRRELP